MMAVTTALNSGTLIITGDGDADDIAIVSIDNSADEPDFPGLQCAWPKHGKLRISLTRLLRMTSWTVLQDWHSNRAKSGLLAEQIDAIHSRAEVM
jgi:hypothetical protein